MDRYQVTLIDPPGDQVAFLAAFRTIGKIALADAVKVYAEAMNARATVLVAGIDLTVADHIAATFAGHGMAVSVEPSALASPMVCRPQANIAYRPNAARVLVVAPAQP